MGFDPFVIKINHRKLLTGILESVEISSDRHIDALIILDKYDKIGEDALIDEFERKGFSLEFISKMFDFFKTVVDYRLEELNKPTNSKIDVNNKILDVLDDFIGNHKNRQRRT